MLVTVLWFFQMDLPAGLTNLGNTCYMNATVQCLKTVPELRDALRSFQGGTVQPVLSILKLCQGRLNKLKAGYGTI